MRGAKEKIRVVCVHTRFGVLEINFIGNEERNTLNQIGDWSFKLDYTGFMSWSPEKTGAPPHSKFSCDIE